jgi:hypothetical protein
MRPSLDSLLGSEEPNASFHDASLLAIHVDYVSRTLTAELALFTDDPSLATDRSKRVGRLHFQDLLHWSLEPSAARGALEGPPWLTSDGPLASAPTETGLQIAGSLPQDCFAIYLYFSDLNAFAYVASRTARFEWIEAAAQQDEMRRPAS